MDDGFASLIAKMDSLKGEALDRAERKALRRVGDIVKDAIVERTPVQAGVVEGLLSAGQLKASITARVHIATDERTTTGDNDRVTIGPNSSVTRSVANWVENGHAGPKPKSPRTKPHAFVRPAFDSVEQTATDAYVETMTAEINAVMEK